jgi:hypothetical protein
VAGGPDDEGLAVTGGQGGDAGGRGVEGEVDYDVDLGDQGRGIVALVDADDGDARRGSGGGDGLAHPALGAVEEDA